MSEDVIENWLAVFGRHLGVRGRRRQRILAEVTEHLRDAAADGSATTAVARFGAPAAMAEHFTASPRRRPSRAVLLWMPAAVAATICCATVYGAGQQALRSGANDPQTQIAEDAALRLSGGAAASEVVTGPQVDLARSLAVTVSVIDSDGRVLASTASLAGRPARPPLGALRAAETSGLNVLTWQPRPGVRQAAAITAFRGRDAAGTVVVSRSLRLVEQRESTLLRIVALGWLLALAAAAVVALLVTRWWVPREPGDPMHAAPVLA